MSKIKIGDIETIGWRQMPGGMNMTMIFFLPKDGRTYKMFYNFDSNRCQIQLPMIKADGSKIANILYDHKVRTADELAGVTELVTSEAINNV